MHPWGVALAVVARDHGPAVIAAPGDYRAQPGVEATAFDYDVNSSMKPALQDVDRVFMLSKWTDLHPGLALNRFVEHALAVGVQHLVFTTGMGVDKQPAVGLTMMEKRIAGSGMGYTFLHPPRGGCGGGAAARAPSRRDGPAGTVLAKDCLPPGVRR